MSQGYENFFRAAKKARKQGEKPKRKELSAFTEDELRRIFKVKPEKPTQPRAKASVKGLRKTAPVPILALTVIGVIFGLLGWWVSDEKMAERLIAYSPHQWLEIRALTGAQAEEKPSPAAQVSNSAKDPSANAGEPAPKTETPVGAEELAHLTKLRERNESLDRREKELSELEEELLKQKTEVEKRIQQLEQLREQIANVLKERVEADQAKVAKLVETYSNMRPKQAAEILAGMDEDLAIQILGQMKKKNAAEIMNLLDPGKARTISEKFAGFRRN